MKPDSDTHAQTPSTLSAALNLLGDRCQDTAHWVGQPTPLGAVQHLLKPLVERHNDWVIWRDRDHRLLLGVGVIRRQSFTEWSQAAQTCASDEFQAPFVFFGGRFDPDHPIQKPIWRGYPGIEVYHPQVVIEWSEAQDTTPMVWTQSAHFATARKVCLNLNAEIADPPDHTEGSRWTPIEPRVEWADRIEKLHHHFGSSTMEKVVMARAVSTTLPMSKVSVTFALASLLKAKSDDIIFAFSREGSVFLGCTPETLADLEEGRVMTHALAGTQAMNQSDTDFINDAKIQREHRAVVNDVCEKLKTMSQDVMIDPPRLRYAKAVVHLETKISAFIGDTHLLNVVGQLHPTPALGGSPTEKALEWLRSDETLDRGWYGGPVGWFNAQGQGRCAVAIRSALLTEQRAYAFAGAGIVHGSDPATEWQETSDKLGSVLSALNGSIQ